MTQKKKILHLINHYHEGFGYQENYLAYNQKKLGHDAIIVTSDYYFPFPNYEDTVQNILGKRKIGIGEFYDNGIKIIRKKSFFQNFGSPNLVWFSIKKELFTFKPNIIHIHNPTNFFLFEVLYYKKKLGYKIFIDSHQDYIVENKKNKILKNISNFIWRFVFNFLNQDRHISAYLPITESSKIWLKKNLKLKENKMVISNLGVDENLMKYSEESALKFRKNYNITDKIIIVNAGKQYEEKNIEWIIKVAKKAYSTNKKVFLILVGSASEEYNEKINFLLSDFTNNFLRLPFLKRNELKEVYCASDIGIWPGVPSNTIQEAMLCEVALIIPDNNIVGHLIQNNGIKENKDTELAAKFIIDCIDDSDKLKNLKKNSKQIALNYSWSNITRELEKIYLIK